MDRDYRRDTLKTVHPEVQRSSCLAELDRQYTLNEICIITRAGPAKILGLTHKGHLGTGADADITIYEPHENKQLMFELPKYVIKAGQILVDQGEIRETTFGKTLHVAPEHDLQREKEISDWFEKYYTIRFRNYPVGDEYLQKSQVVSCDPQESSGS